MNKENTLKNQLLAIRENDWKIPEGMDSYSLAKDLLQNIGSIDPELRDDLILEMLCKIIVRQDISHDQTKQLLEQCLSDQHLSYGVGKVEDDSVFNRAFTLLVVEEIISANNKSELAFLTQDEVEYVLCSTLKYLTVEKDFRGYDEVKGWAHATAHAADLLATLAKSKFINEEGLINILNAISAQICINSYTYIDNEDERLVTATMAILDRQILNAEEINNWINNFLTIEIKGNSFQSRHLAMNRKNFLRSLYFRLKKTDAHVTLATVAEQGLKQIAKF